MPQKIHRNSSIVKLWGYFSRSGQGLSAATMSMQWAGQAVAQRKQATHFTRPCVVPIEPVHAAVNQRIGNLVPLFGRLDRLFAAETGAGAWSSALGRTASRYDLPASPSRGSFTQVMFLSLRFHGRGVAGRLRIFAGCVVGGHDCVVQSADRAPRSVVAAGRIDHASPRARTATSALQPAAAMPQLGRKSRPACQRHRRTPSTRPPPPGSPAPRESSPSSPMSINWS